MKKIFGKKGKYLWCLPVLALLPALTEAAGRDDHARRQRLQRSADQWFRERILPGLLRGSELESVSSFGVTVQEKPVVLPPDLGGPLPNRPVTVTVRVRLTGMGYDHYDRFYRKVTCEFSQKLLARPNGQGRPESILPGQGMRAPLACYSGYLPNPRDYGRNPGDYGWR
jgi:hypothetical protein